MLSASVTVQLYAGWVLPDPKTEEELRQAIAAVKGNKNLPRLAIRSSHACLPLEHVTLPLFTRPPYPKLPKMDIKTPVKKRLRQIQKYISALQYNHTGRPSEHCPLAPARPLHAHGRQAILLGAQRPRHVQTHRHSQKNHDQCRCKN